MTTQVTVPFASKAAARLEGALAEPSGHGKSGGVVVVQEWHGVNDYVKSTCERFAAAGFVALAPDLYHGKVVTTTEDAGQMMASLDKKNAVQEIDAAAQFLRGHARCNGHVAVVGFCMGGALALTAARFVDGLKAAVAFYGLPDTPIDTLAKIAIPLQGHFAQRDGWAKASTAEELKTKITAAGGKMDLYVYEAGHAFMRNTDPQVYDAASAALAWQRTTDFLKRELA